jgi:hypothetical protein
MIFTFKLNHKGFYDFECSDIGFEQEDALLESQSIITNQVSHAIDFNNRMSHVKRNINTQDSEELVSKKDSVVSPPSHTGEWFLLIVFA